jgi:hypothetical protein
VSSPIIHYYHTHSRPLSEYQTYIFDWPSSCHRIGCPPSPVVSPSRHVLIIPCTLLPTHFLGGTEEEGISIVSTEGHSDLSISNRCSGIALSARLVRRAGGRAAGIRTEAHTLPPSHHGTIGIVLQKRNTRSVDRSYFVEATLAEFICWQINQPMSCQFVCSKRKDNTKKQRVQPRDHPAFEVQV